MQMLQAVSSAGGTSLTAGDRPTVVIPGSPGSGVAPLLRSPLPATGTATSRLGVPASGGSASGGSFSGCAGPGLGGGPPSPARRGVVFQLQQQQQQAAGAEGAAAGAGGSAEGTASELL